MNKTKLELEEDLIIDMGYTKYLKIPMPIKRHFGLPVPNVNPKSRFEEDDDKIKIIYIFKRLDFTKDKVKTKSKKPSTLRVDMGFSKYLKIPENVKKRYGNPIRSEEHTSELQSHSFISYAVFCLKKKKINSNTQIV